MMLPFDRFIHLRARSIAFGGTDRTCVRLCHLPGAAARWLEHTLHLKLRLSGHLPLPHPLCPHSPFGLSIIFSLIRAMALCVPNCGIREFALGSMKNRQ